MCSEHTEKRPSTEQTQKGEQSALLEGFSFFLFGGGVGQFEEI